MEASAGLGGTIDYSTNVSLVLWGKYIPQMTITIAPVLFRVSTFSALLNGTGEGPIYICIVTSGCSSSAIVSRLSFVRLADQFRQIWYSPPDLLHHTLQQLQPFRSDGIYALKVSWTQR